jgi:hypothetical protein
MTKTWVTHHRQDNDEGIDNGREYKLKELELKKHDLESDIVFLKSAYKYDLQRLEYQLGGIDNKLLGLEHTIRSQHRERNGADESVTVKSAGQ